jgi:molybdate transport system substrate-binding protein
VLTKVTSGEVDAGLVYASDATAAGAEVDVVRPENASEVVTTDMIARVAGSEKAEAARDWIHLVTGTAGQEVLTSHGFGPRT